MEKLTNPFLDARRRLNLSQKELANKINTSLFALVRWERGDLQPSSDILGRLSRLFEVNHDEITNQAEPKHQINFESNGIRARNKSLPLFDTQPVPMLRSPRLSLISEIMDGELWGNSRLIVADILARRDSAAVTRDLPLDEEISAGKNTYTYDAHTYHTKVPPQGIAKVISKYLPNGGLVLDPFAGSGMTGVAARYLGMEVILNELSPAASFIAHNFTRIVNSSEYGCAVAQVMRNLENLRISLYTTKCRECCSEVEAQYIVWSYLLSCNHCEGEFVLWDHCRKYGRNVREHKLLKKFPCPHCDREVNKSYLHRLAAVPVFLGYKCCAKKIVEHNLEPADFDQIKKSQGLLERYYEHIPKTVIPDGVNLNQPKRHGLDSIEKFYTRRNLVACAAIWKEVKRIEDPDLAAAVGFAFTSLYQRVTRLSEYRFWGGSGNTANFNVPHISNEANVFITFERKAQSIADHFVTTAQNYGGRCAIRTGSATNLSMLPDNSIDFIFTDPPFGGNINYSEMNILWESWLDVFTDTKEEAIINRAQGKSVDDYEKLMTDSLKEAYRVLRPNHWMVLVFMNSSKDVWRALSASIKSAGFRIKKVSIFDKQHGTFKQFVSENTAGADLMLHCKKVEEESLGNLDVLQETLRVSTFLENEADPIPIFPFLHVARDAEVDYRTLYSRYIAKAIQSGVGVIGFAQFRLEAASFLGEGQ